MITTNKLTVLISFCLSLSVFKAQLPYSEKFDNGTCNTSFPSNWNTASTTSDWAIDDNSTTCSGWVIQCPLGTGGSALTGFDLSTGLESATSASFSTIGYNNITVQWNGYRSSGAPSVTLEYSLDNINYTTVPFTDVASDNAWHTSPTISLPSAVNNKQTVYLRWSYTGSGNGFFVSFDDLFVNGTQTGIYYWNGSAPNLLSSWGSNPDGSGSNPVDFTTSGQTFNMYNSTTNIQSASLTGNWAVSGGNVSINLGDGNTKRTHFTVPAAYLLSLNNATLQVVSNSTLSLANGSLPASSNININIGSTIEFAQTIPISIYDKIYHNLVLSGGSVKNISGYTTINGELILSGTNLKMSNNNMISLNLNGTVSGNGMILTGNSILNIAGSGNFGTLTFGIGSSMLTINKLNINRVSGSIILGSDLTVSGNSAFNNGLIYLNGKTLTLNGAITFPASQSAGSFAGSTGSSLNIRGSGSIVNSLLFDQSNSANKSMKDIYINRSGSVLSLGNPVDVYGSITPTVGTIAAGNGNLTLKSTATAKGRVGEIGPNGALTGNAVVETLAKGGSTGYNSLSAAGVYGATFNDWNDDFSILCPSCPDGNMLGNTLFNSISSYDESAFTGDTYNALHFVPITSITNTIGVGKGWWVYLGNGQTTTTDILIDLKGSVVQGTLPAMPITLTGSVSNDNGWNLIGNPYPSPISFSKVISGNTNNLENTLYVWNPDLNGGNGDYAIYTPNVGSVPPVNEGGVDDNIPTGQAFMIRALNNFSIHPAENWKSNTYNTNAMLKVNNNANPSMSNMFILNLTGGNNVKNFNTMAAININSNATNGYDQSFDAVHISNPFGNAEIFTTAANTKLKINSIPPVSGSYTIPVSVNSSYNGIYKITPININNFATGACIQLHDRLSNNVHDLRSGSYTFNISDSTYENRFFITIGLNPSVATTSLINPLCKNSSNGAIIASSSLNGPWDYFWKDSTGNVIKTSYNKTTADTLNNLSEGFYHVDITSAGSCSNDSKDIILTANNTVPVASFILSSDSINVNSNTPLNIINTSINSTTFVWNFGDGNTSTAVNATHSYTVPGTYQIVLLAINACGDTSSVTHTVKAYNNVITTSIYQQISENGNGNVIVRKTEEGIVIDIQAEIKSTNNYYEVYNLIGQKLMETQKIENNTRRIIVPIQSNESILLINTFINNKNQTKKIMN